MLQNRLNLFTRSYARNVGFALCPDHPSHVPEFLVQHMLIKKYQRIECLVLGCGRYLSVHRQRCAARLPVAVVNPRHARAFAKATGQLATTDAREARALAHVAEAVRPTPRPLPAAQADELRALLVAAAAGGDAHGRTEPARP